MLNGTPVVSRGVLYCAAIEFYSRDTDNLWSRSQLADIPTNKFPVGTAIFMGFVIRKPAVRKEAICSIADTILQRGDGIVWCARTRARTHVCAGKTSDALNASFRCTQTRVIRKCCVLRKYVKFSSAISQVARLHGINFERSSAVFERSSRKYR